MSEAFHQKLAFVLKALSISRGALAAEVGVDKSAVGRWVSGRVEPSAHNLARLSGVIAKRAPGFAVLDWERPFESLAQRFGARPTWPPMAATRAGCSCRWCARVAAPPSAAAAPTKASSARPALTPRRPAASSGTC